MSGDQSLVWGYCLYHHGTVTFCNVAIELALGYKTTYLTSTAFFPSCLFDTVLEMTVNESFCGYVMISNSSVVIKTVPSSHVQRFTLNTVPQFKVQNSYLMKTWMKS